MKPKVIGILKGLRAQPEIIDGRRLPNQSTPFDWMWLAKETLPNATPLTPEERFSINEFFWSHFK